MKPENHYRTVYEAGSSPFDSKAEIETFAGLSGALSTVCRKDGFLNKTLQPNLGNHYKLE